MKVSNIVSLSILAAAAAAAESYPGEDKNRNDPEQQPGAHSPETYALSAKDQQAVVEEHNIKRALHVDTPPLVWDDTLAQFAEKLAAQYSCYSGELHHSGADYGENLALGYSATGAVDGWYNEIKSYNYSSSAIQPATGHFTQVVWRDSKRVGCAIRYCNSYWGNYMICEYDPSGNYLGEFADNVMPLKVSLNGDASSSVTASSSATASATAQSSSLGTAVYSQSSRLYGNTTVATSHTSSAMASNKARTSSIVATTKNHDSSMAASTKGTHASVTATTKQNNNGNGNGNNAAAPTTTVQDNIASKTGDSVVKIRTVYTTNGVVVTTFTTYCPESDKTIQTPVPEQTTTTTKNAPAAAAVTATTTTTCSTAANVAKAQDVKSTTTVVTVANGQDVEATTTVATVAKGQDAGAATTTVANVAKTQEATTAAVTTTLEGTITPSAPHIEQQTGVQGFTQSTSVSEAHVGANTESAPGLQAFEGSASNMNPNFILGAIAMIFMSLL